MIDVSVLMSAYNAEKHIIEAIKSILCQTFGDFEFLIINDGSTDSTESIIKSYKDSRIKLINNQKNLGLIKSLNLGIEVSRGNYIARMDADDIAFPDRLATQIDFMEKHPEAVLSGACAETVDAQKKHIGFILPPFEDACIRTALYFNNCYIHSLTIFRRKDAIAVGGYNEEDVHAEDYGFWLRLAERGQLANLNEVLLKYRCSDENISTRHQNRQRETVFNLSCKALAGVIDNEVRKDSYRRFWHEWQCGQTMIRTGDMKQLEPLWNFAADLPRATEFLGKTWEELALKLMRSGRIAAGLNLLRILKNNFGVKSGFERKLIAVGRGLFEKSAKTGKGRR